MLPGEEAPDSMPTIRKRKPKPKIPIPYGVLYVVWDCSRRKKKAIYVGQATIGRKGRNNITIDKNGKLYASFRIGQHKSAARRGEGGEIDKHMGKVGIENFEFETLQIPYRNKVELSDWEFNFAEEYKTFHKYGGFNMAMWRQSGPDYVSDATSKKISESARKGHENMSPEVKKVGDRKRSESNKETYAKKTEEERIAVGKKVSAKTSGKIRNPNRKRKRVNCKVEDCEKERDSGTHGYCEEHYEEALISDRSIAPHVRDCKTRGCDKPGWKQGFCKYHRGVERRKNRPPAVKERRAERRRERRRKCREEQRASK